MDGRLLDGRYQLLQLIGRGGHGVVYRALDQQTNQHVAVKLLGDTSAEPEFYVRMVREARAMSALAGTSAVKVHGSGSDLDGAFYIIMELLEGLNFDQYLHSIEARGQRLATDMCVRIMEPICETLDAAHDRGIVHRDLKPSNIFLVEHRLGGGVRLLDFGLVKLMGARPLTREGMVAGSPNYIAPEAWSGNSATLDHRIDVYSFAALLFRSLAGQVPFVGTDLLEKMIAVTTAPRPSLHRLRPDLPPEVDTWVAQAMAIDPNYRFTRIKGMWNAFRHIIRV